MSASLPQHLPQQWVFLTGATGFVGSRLLELLLEHSLGVICLCHNRQPNLHDQKYAEQLKTITTMSELPTLIADLTAQVANASTSPVSTNREAIELLGCVHLAGAGIADWPWTSKRRAVLERSRFQVLDELIQLPVLFKRIIAASAIGVYGDCGDEVVTEQTPAGSGFAAALCQGVEQRLEALAQAQTAPWAALRLGVILGPGGGLLERMALPYKYGLGAIVGSGEQWLSWVDREDVVRAIMLLLGLTAEQAISGSSVAKAQPMASTAPDPKSGFNACGVFNVVSPNPVPWRVFAQSLAQVQGAKTRLRVPSLFLRPLGELRRMFLDSVRGEPTRLQALGFQFNCSHLDRALAGNLSHKGNQ